MITGKDQSFFFFNSCNHFRMSVRASVTCLTPITKDPLQNFKKTRLRGNTNDVFTIFDIKTLFNPTHIQKIVCTRSLIKKIFWHNHILNIKLNSFVISKCIAWIEFFQEEENSFFLEPWRVIKNQFVMHDVGIYWFCPSHTTIWIREMRTLTMVLSVLYCRYPVGIKPRLSIKMRRKIRSVIISSLRVRR